MRECAVHGVRGDSVSLGVDVDPGVRERPVVRWAAGPECMERGGEQGGPTVGGVRCVGEQRYGGMEWVAGCGGATQASTPTGVVFGGTRDTRCPPGVRVPWEPDRFGLALATHGVRPERLKLIEGVAGG